MPESPEGDALPAPGSAIDSTVPPPAEVVAPAAEAAARAEPAPATALDLHIKLGPLQDADVRRPRAAQVWAWAMAGGGLAGLVAWLLGEYAIDWFPHGFRPGAAAGGRTATSDALDLAAAQAAEIRNAVLAFGLIGGLLGGLLGLAGGMIRPSLRAGVIAGVIGAALGIAAGAAASFGVAPPYDRFLAGQDGAQTEILGAMAALGIVWGAVGAAGGAAFGLGMGGFRRAALGLIGGGIGGALGAVAFELIAAAAFPLDDATRLLSDSRESRLAARALLALFVSAGVAACVAPTRFREVDAPST